jgi:hypothetical protein
MVRILVLWYFHFKDWWFLFRKGCLKSHDFDYIVISKEDYDMFFEHCTRCHYVQGISERGVE